MVFGDSNDPDSKVSQVMNSPRGYKVLEELNTAPSIIYLKKVRDDV
jgi:molybdopterin-containing oxidoreductase family iron-sulfur binding subunit